MWYKKKTHRHANYHTHTLITLTAGGGRRFCSLLKLEGVHIQKDAGYEIVDFGSQR